MRKPTNRRVLFISPCRTAPISENGQPVQKLRTNFSLPGATVLGALEAAEYEVFFIDAAAEGWDQSRMLGDHVLTYGLTDEAVLERIEEIDPRWVLITSMFSFEQVLVDQLVRVIKARFPKKPVVLGGIHASIKPEWHFEDSNPDFIVLNEGEEAIVQLLGALEQDVPNVAKIPGIAYRDTSGIIRKTLPSERLANLDRPWALDSVLLLPNEQPRYIERLTRKSPVYASESLPDDSPTFALYGSRGCPFGCPYCPTLPRDGAVIRHMGADRMFRDFLKARKQYQVGVFYNQADTFGFHEEDRRFLRMVADYRQQTGDTKFVTNNPDAFFVHLFFPRSLGYQLDEELVNLLSIAGLNVVTLAVETFSARFNKKIDWQYICPEQITELCHVLHDKGIRTDIYMMYGFPGQTQDEFDRDLRHASALLEHADTISWHFCTLLSGTNYYDAAIASSRITEAGYRRDVRNGYSFFYPVDDYNLSGVPTAHLRASVADFGMAWV
jgi:radical SAM superfamily enzyme YgiQ (UPF0313 family)